MPEFKRARRTFAARNLMGAVSLWSAPVAAYAAWAVVVPHRLVFGPKIGPFASFAVFVVCYSALHVFATLALYLLLTTTTARPDTARPDTSVMLDLERGDT